MDPKLTSWARRAKARTPGGLPPLWLFLDQARLPDATRAIAALPCGLAGIICRAASGRPHGAALAALCRRKKLTLAAAPGAGHPACRALLCHAGAATRRRPAPAITASAHNGAELGRAHRAGAALIFLSPVFPTQSHPGAPALGLRRWMALAARDRRHMAALGGIDARRLASLPRWCTAIGAIGALTPALSYRHPAAETAPASTPDANRAR